jgi:hypothetical protein
LGPCGAGIVDEHGPIGAEVADPTFSEAFAVPQAAVLANMTPTRLTDSARPAKTVMEDLSKSPFTGSVYHLTGGFAWLSGLTRVHE